MSEDDHPKEVATEHLRRFGGGALGPFSQMLVVGLAVCLLSLPLVTAVPALAAGALQFASHLEATDDSLKALWKRFLEAFRAGGWLVGIATVGVLALLVASAVASFQGFIPGGLVIGWITVAIAVIGAVIVSRAASLWHPGAQWQPLLIEAAELTVIDPIGSLFVLSGYGIAAVVVWMLPPLVVIAPGLVVLTLVASERRRLTKENS